MIRNIVLILLSIASFALSGCSKEDEVPTAKISKFTTKIRGYLVGEHVVLSSKYKPMWIQNVATGYKHENAVAMPKKLEIIKSSRNCKIEPPSEEAELFHANVGHTKRRIGIYTADQEEFLEDVGRLIDAVKRKGDGEIRFRPRGGHSLPVVDVFVTKSENPIYLVLTSQGSTVWNIQAQDGVNFEKIVLISRDVAGVANVDENTPVEAFDGKSLKKCGIAPAREPQQHWSLYKRAIDGEEGDKEVLKKSQRAYSAYSRWFDKTFKRSSREQRVTANRLEHILLGNVPRTLDERIAYKPMSLSTLKMTKTKYLFVKGKDDFKKEYEAMIHKKVQKLTGLNINENVYQ